MGCRTGIKDNIWELPQVYTLFGRLTDPEEHISLISSLPRDVNKICKIANKRLIHYGMLSQYEIPKPEWNTRQAKHDIKDISDTFTLKIPSVAQAKYRFVNLNNIEK